jgi:hypothetical protein
MGMTSHMIRFGGPAAGPLERQLNGGVFVDFDQFPAGGVRLDFFIQESLAASVALFHFASELTFP